MALSTKQALQSEVKSPFMSYTYDVYKVGIDLNDKFSNQEIRPTNTDEFFNNITRKCIKRKC